MAEEKKKGKTGVLLEQRWLIYFTDVSTCTQCIQVGMMILAVNGAAAAAAANTAIGECAKNKRSAQSKWNAIAWNRNRMEETRYVSSSVLLSFAATINYVENRERV